MKATRRLCALTLCFALLLTLAGTCLGVSVADYSSWFAGDFTEMNTLGLIPDSFAGYNLKSDITSGEMCRLAVHAFEKITKDSIEPSRTDYFSDTSETVILQAYEAGIVSGYPDGTFRPDQKLTRQEFFQIILNFCNAAAFRPSPDGTDMSKFLDYSQVASWATDAAQICYKCGYVYGTAVSGGSVLNPNGYTSRQEAMAMFLRAYKGVNEYYYGLVLSATVQADGYDEDDVSVKDYTDTLYVDTDKLNVRDSWTSSSTAVGTLTRGEAVNITGKCSNGWYRINYEGHVAYVHGGYLRDSSGASQTIDVSGSGAGVEIANFAMQFVGYSYVYAGASPSTGFDCSGLMYYCLGQYGYSMNRTADGQMKQGTSVSRSELQVGDLVFFGYGGYADHVGMYIGGGNFVHASTPSSGVRVDSLDQTYYVNKYIGARRIIG